MHEILTRAPDGQIFMGDKRLCDDAWAWSPDRLGADGATPVSATEALTGLARDRRLQQLLLGVIGPRAAAAEQLDVAEAIGAQLGALGLTVICGGRSGVMEAVCKGVSDGGGLPIGILPGTDPAEANPFVAIPLTTGLAEARNIVIVRAARVLIAVGTSPGTLTEVAYGLHFGKPVIGIAGAAELGGVRHTQTPQEAVDAALHCLFASLPMRETS